MLGLFIIIYTTVYWTKYQKSGLFLRFFRTISITIKIMVTLALDSNQFFKDVVEEAFTRCKLKTGLYVRIYLTDILKHYLFIGNLYNRKDSSGLKTHDTLAETLLRVNKMGPKERFERLKGLADSSLYISGFFSDSFQRKIIDIDYYIDIGKLAYQTLAQDVEEDTFAKLYKEISNQFINLVDVLSFISQKAEMTDRENLLRTMDVYAKTHSPLREEVLVEKGVFHRPKKNYLKQ